MSETTAQTKGPAPLPRPKRRRRWVTVLLALVIFGAGFVGGGGTAVLVIVRRVQHTLRHPGEAPRRITRRLQRRLKLTDEQAEKVLAVVTRRQQALLAIRREVQPRVLTEIEGAYADVADLLDDAQRDRWRRIYDSLRSQWLPPLPPPAAPATRPASAPT